MTARATVALLVVAALAAVVLRPSSSSALCADISLNGFVTQVDALTVLTAAVGAGSCPPVRCDVDSSGDIGVADAIVVQGVADGGILPLECSTGADGWYPASGVQPHYQPAADDAFRVHPTRPRLYFRQDDVSRLLERGTGALSEQWAELEWMASSMSELDPGGSTATASVKGWYGEKGRAVALMALLTGNSDYRDWAVAWAKALAALPVPTADTPLRARIQRMAVVYDWLHDQMSSADRAAIREGLLRYVEALRALDYMQEPSYIGGHARWGYSVLAMALIALHGDFEDSDDLLAQCRQRIAGGFYPAQAWIADNGGYHMGWAYASSYTNPELPYLIWTVGTNDVLLDDWLVETGDWFLYGLRGDDAFPQSGDAFSVDVNLATSSIIYAAGVGRRPQARWYVEEKLGPKRDPFLQLLLLDPDTPVVEPDTLPGGRLFRNAGVVIARDGWGEDTTHFTFKSSSFNSTNHHHRDQNTFTLHYKAPLAIDSGYYDAYGSSHFKNYFSRTIAHNGIVVHDPEQAMVRFGEEVSNDGGQLFHAEPTTLEEIGPGGQASLDGILRFENRSEFTYALGDATKAYDPARVTLAQREVVYLPEPGRPHPVVVVFDRVGSSDPTFDKRFLLHTVNRPTVSGSHAVAENGGGRLTSVTVYPVDAHIDRIGGSGNEFSVDGTNYALASSDDWNEAAEKGIEPGSWRLEVSSDGAGTETQFLHALFVDDAGAQAVSADAAQLVEQGDALGVQLEDWVVVFRRSADGTGSIEYPVPSSGTRHHLVTGLAPNRTYSYRVGAGTADNVTTGGGGCAVFDATADAGETISVSQGLVGAWGTSMARDALASPTSDLVHPR